MRRRDAHARPGSGEWRRARSWRHDHPRGRWPRPFVRRLALFVLFFLTLSTAGASLLVSWLLQRAGFSGAGLGPVMALALAFAAVVLFFVVTMRRVGLPFGEIVAAADRVAEGDYDTRVSERGPPFLRVVAGAFNGMTARLQEQDRHRRNLLADIAHELRTPLAVMQGRLEGVLDGVYARDDARIGELLDDTRMLVRLVEDLGTLAHAERGGMALRKEPTDVALLVHDGVRALEPESRARHVAVTVDTHPDLDLVEVDPVRLREVVVNLVANAIRHSQAGTEVVVAAEQVADRIVIRVRDNGPGIAAEDLPKIFERFHKGARSQGSGLGLAIARQLVLAHGGEIAVESEVGKGTTFTVRVPSTALEA